MHTQPGCTHRNRGNEHTRDGGRISDSHHSSSQENRWQLGETPDRREREGVATQEVLVNYAACSSHLQQRKKHHHQKNKQTT